LKEKIHPKWFEATVVCSCGNTFKTGSTRERLHVEICSACHPFFTGNQKFVDTEGRVEKFMTKYGTVTSKQTKKEQAKAERVKAEAEAAKAQAEKAEAAKVLAAAEAPAAEAAAPETVAEAAPAKRKRASKPRARKPKAKAQEASAE
jgi:large subunit ribosomal protein L31